MAIDLHVIGRIEKRGIDRAVADHFAQECDFAPVAAADAVLAQLPDVTGLRTGCFRDGRNDLVVGVFAVFQDHVDLARAEARQTKINVDVRQ